MSETKLTCKIGADPEFFLRRKNDGKLVSAHGLIPGTKDKPHRVNDGAIQVDGMAVEINIDPAETAPEFVHNIQSVIQQLSSMLPEYDFVYEPSVIFDKDVWDSTPDQAKQLGCTPDFDAYSGTQNIIIPPEENSPLFRMRTAAGHVHIGWTSNMDVADATHIEACQILVKELDYYLSLPLNMASGSDAELQRKILYGKSGACRYKPYGVEYRTPSNFWLRSTDTMVWVFNQTKAVFDKLLDGKAKHQNRSDFVSYYDYNPAIQTPKDINRMREIAVSLGYSLPILEELFGKSVEGKRKAVEESLEKKGLSQLKTFKEYEQFMSEYLVKG